MNVASKVLALAGFAAASAAQAHIAVGTYRGKDNYGAECSIKVNDVSFDGGYKHPLNERVEVIVGLVKVVLAHLPKIDPVNHTVTQEKGVLTAAAADSEQSFGLIVRMSHDETHTGPAEYVYVKQDRLYPGSSETYICSGLKKVD